MGNGLNALTAKKEIVIIGGGFAGINLARKLARDERFAITLVDSNNYTYFVPLVYQVASGFLETSNISYPFRKLFRNTPSVHFRLGTLKKIDAETNSCSLDNGDLRYDYLVLATGCESNFFKNCNIARNAIPMKTLNDALEMKNKLLQTLEEACIEDDVAVRKKLLTMVIAGGGPTGVEVAGVIAELRKYIITKDYPELAGAMGDIIIVQGAAQLLPTMSYQSHQQAFTALRKLGVIIKLKTFVKDFDGTTITLSDGQQIASKNLIWAAGIIARKVDGIPEQVYDRANRMMVDAANKVIGTRNVYAIGDTCSQVTDPNFPYGHPQLAQVAIQQGRKLAANLMAIVDHRQPEPFLYKDQGTMAIIGRNYAVVDLTFKKIHLGGLCGLFIWLFIHLASLITNQNKIKTLYNWIVSYLTRDLHLRMIVRPFKKALPIETQTEQNTPLANGKIYS